MILEILSAHDLAHMQARMNHRPAIFSEAPKTQQLNFYIKRREKMKINDIGSYQLTNLRMEMYNERVQRTK